MNIFAIHNNDFMLYEKNSSESAFLKLVKLRKMYPQIIALGIHVCISSFGRNFASPKISKHVKSSLYY